MYSLFSFFITWREVNQNRGECGEWQVAKALTETNELIFLVNPENYNEALNRKNTLFCQKGEKLQDPDGTNNLLLKMKFRNGLFL